MENIQLPTVHQDFSRGRDEVGMEFSNQSNHPCLRDEVGRDLSYQSNHPSLRDRNGVTTQTITLADENLVTNQTVTLAEANITIVYSWRESVASAFQL